MLDRLNHDDRVVDDDTDRQHQAEQGQIVEAEAEDRHRRERPDHGDRHRDQRNQRRTPILQKYQHDGGHQHDRVEQRLEHFADRFPDERSRVIDDLVVDAGRKAVTELLHALTHFSGHVEGVRSRQLIDRKRDGWLLVERAGLIVGLGAHFDVRDILEMDESAAVVAEDNVGELIGVSQSAERGDDVLRDLSLGSRRLTDLPGGDLHVLGLHRVDHVLGVQVIGGELLRIEPEAHAVVALAEVGDVAYAGQAREFVADLDGGVVAQLEGRSAFVAGDEVDDH